MNIRVQFFLEQLVRHQIDLKYGANQVPPLAAPNKTKSKGSQGAGAFCDEARPPRPPVPDAAGTFYPGSPRTYTPAQTSFQNGAFARR